MARFGLTRAGVAGIAGVGSCAIWLGSDGRGIVWSGTAGLEKVRAGWVRFATVRNGALRPAREGHGELWYGLRSRSGMQCCVGEWRGGVRYGLVSLGGPSSGWARQGSVCKGMKRSGAPRNGALRFATVWNGMVGAERPFRFAVARWAGASSGSLS